MTTELLDLPNDVLSVILARLPLTSKMGTGMNVALVHPQLAELLRHPAFPDVYGSMTVHVPKQHEGFAHKLAAWLEPRAKGFRRIAIDGAALSASAGGTAAVLVAVAGALAGTGTQLELRHHDFSFDEAAWPLDAVAAAGVPDRLCSVALTCRDFRPADGHLDRLCALSSLSEADLTLQRTTNASAATADASGATPGGAGMLLLQLRWLRRLTLRDCSAELVPLLLLPADTKPCEAPALEELRIVDCPALAALPLGIKQLCNLRQLTVEGTGIGQLPPGLSQLPQLSRLVLDRNPFLQLGPGLAGCTALREVTLGCLQEASGAINVLLRLPSMRLLDVSNIAWTVWGRQARGYGSGLCGCGVEVRDEAWW